jgi:enoyl-CoA hydratase
MTRVIEAVLARTVSDNDICGIVISGEGERGFCAGGDLKGLYRNGMAFKQGQMSDNAAEIFFREEYDLNLNIKNYSKTNLYIAFLNGIVMGGGYGASGHGSHQIGTEKTCFAMPEVRIGFFPDIGASYNLLRCPGKTGLYLAMTGRTINAADMYDLGLCQYIVDSEKRFELLNALDADPNNTDSVLERFHDATLLDDLRKQAEVIPHQAQIDDWFSGQGAIEIYDAVKAASDNGDRFAQQTLEYLDYAAPLSVHIAFEQMRRAEGMSLEQVLEQDFTLACNFLRGDDLFEGIKAAVIDKSHQKTWQHKSVYDVVPDEVAQYFVPVKKA